MQTDFLPDIYCLRLIWWGLACCTAMGFAVKIGGDFGKLMLLPFFDSSRHKFYHADKTARCLLLLGAVLVLAAFPFLPKVLMMYPFFLAAMMMGLVSLFLFPLAVRMRNNRIVFSIAGFCLAFLFGLVIGCVLTGISFQFSPELAVQKESGFFIALSAFSLFCGLTGVVCSLLLGAAELAVFQQEKSQIRALQIAKFAAIAAIMLFASGLLFIMGGLQFLQAPYDVFDVKGQIIALDFFQNFNAHKGAVDPLHKKVMAMSGGWLGNYSQYRWIVAVPVAAFASTIGLLIFVFVRKAWAVLLFARLTVCCLVAAVAASMFPFILPSGSNPDHSLTIYDSSADQAALGLLLIPAVAGLVVLLVKTMRARKSAH